MKNKNATIALMVLLIQFILPWVLPSNFNEATGRIVYLILGLICILFSVISLVKKEGTYAGILLIIFEFAISALFFIPLA